MKGTHHRRCWDIPVQCRTGWAMWVLAGAVAITAVTQATANEVRFDNPPGAEHFVWYGGTSTDPIGLEIINDAASQTGTFGGIAQFHQSNELPYGDMVSGGVGGGELQTGGPWDGHLVGVDAGVEIPSGTPWFSSGMIFEPDYGTYLPPAGTATYLGVCFPLDGDIHYGWIGVVPMRMTIEGVDTLVLDTFAWAYETEPDTPIVTPEPASFVVLAFGAAFAGFMRRRA